MQPMQSPRRWRASHMLIVAMVLAAGIYWIVQTFRRGAFSLDPTNAASVVRSRPADGERNVPVETKIIATLKPGTSIEAEGLHEAVHLYRADGRPVMGSATTNKAGDEITFMPLGSLEPATRYIFQISGAKDAAGADVIPYGISFTTAAASP